MVYSIIDGLMQRTVTDISWPIVPTITLKMKFPEHSLESADGTLPSKSLLIHDPMTLDLWAGSRYSLPVLGAMESRLSVTSDNQWFPPDALKPTD
jgi:hypothetical protein